MNQTVEFSKIIVDKVYKAPYQKKNTLTAQLRQVVSTTTTYENKLSDSLSDSLFTLDEFGLEPSSFTSEEIRIAWVNIPEGTSKEDVEERLNDQCRLVKILASEPILSSQQKWAVKEGLTSEEEIGKSQLVKDEDGNIVEYLGGPQYRRVLFSSKIVEDKDWRQERDNSLVAEYAENAQIVE